MAVLRAAIVVADAADAAKLVLNAVMFDAVKAPAKVTAPLLEIVQF